MVSCGKDAAAMGENSLMLLHSPHQEPDAWSKSDEACSSCGEDIHYTEEIVQIQICHAFDNGRGEILTVPFLDDEGGFFFTPHFLEFDCWESLVEDLRAAIKDEPPVLSPRGILRCTYCASDICEWEIFATTHVGELRVSRRSPSGRSTPIFEASTLNEPYITCLSCLLCQSYELDLWDEELNQTGECEECSHARCWRESTCSCLCHTKESDHETPT